MTPAFERGDVVRLSKLATEHRVRIKADPERKELGVVTRTPRWSSTIAVRWDRKGGANVRPTEDRLHPDYLELVMLADGDA